MELKTEDVETMVGCKAASILVGIVEDKILEAVDLGIPVNPDLYLRRGKLIAYLRETVAAIEEEKLAKIIKPAMLPE